MSLVQENMAGKELVVGRIVALEGMDVGGISSVETLLERTSVQADSTGLLVDQLISSIVSDNVISIAEKPELLRKWGEIQAEYSIIVQAATDKGVAAGTITAYSNAYTAVHDLLLVTPGPLLDMTIPTTVNGTSFAATFATYYSARETIINAGNILTSTKLRSLYKRTSAKPARPTVQNPTGWQEIPEVGNGLPLWRVQARVKLDGSWISPLYPTTGLYPRTGLYPCVPSRWSEPEYIAEIDVVADAAAKAAAAEAAAKAAIPTYAPKYIGRFLNGHPSSFNPYDWWLIYATSDTPIQRGVYYSLAGTPTRISAAVGETGYTTDQMLLAKLPAAMADVAWVESQGTYGASTVYGIAAFFISLGAVIAFITQLFAMDITASGSITGLKFYAMNGRLCIQQNAAYEAMLLIANYDQRNSPSEGDRRIMYGYGSAYSADTITQRFSSGVWVNHNGIQFRADNEISLWAFESGNLVRGLDIKLGTHHGYSDFDVKVINAAVAVGKDISYERAKVTYAIDGTNWVSVILIPTPATSIVGLVTVSWRYGTTTVGSAILRFMRTYAGVLSVVLVSGDAAYTNVFQLVGGGSGYMQIKCYDNVATSWTKLKVLTTDYDGD